MDYKEAVNILLAYALCGITGDGCPCDICPAAEGCPCDICPAAEGEDECNRDYKSGERVKQAAYFVNAFNNPKED